MRNVTVLRPAPADPFAKPLTPIGRLMQYRSGTDYDHRVRVAGTATFYKPGESLILEENGKALFVTTTQTSDIALGRSRRSGGVPGGPGFGPNPAGCGAAPGRCGCSPRADRGKSSLTSAPAPQLQPHYDGRAASAASARTFSRRVAVAGRFRHHSGGVGTIGILRSTLQLLERRQHGANHRHQCAGGGRHLELRAKQRQRNSVQAAASFR